MKMLRTLTALGLLTVIMGCSSNPDKVVVAKDPAVVLLTGAAMQIEKLSKLGKLPGFSNNEHGVIRSHRIAGGPTIVYPTEVTLQVEKAAQGDEIYWFVLRKPSEHSEWEVTKAWKTDFQGENKMELKLD